MYPALSSVHTNTLNFVHTDPGILCFFFLLFFAYFFLHFGTFCVMQLRGEQCVLHCHLSMQTRWILKILWLKQRKLTLSHIDLEPISINMTFVRALQKGGKGSYCSPFYLLLYLPVWLRALRKKARGEAGYRCSSKGFALRVVCLSLMGGWTRQSYGHRSVHLSSTLSLLHLLNIKMYLSVFLNVFVQIATYICLSLMGGWTRQSYGHRRAHLSSTLSLSFIRWISKCICLNF